MHNYFSVMSYIFNDTTPLNNSTPFARKAMCLKFWYYYQDTVVGDFLSVEVQSTHLGLVNYWRANSSNAFQKQWLYGRVNLPLSNKDIIRIRASKNDQNSVIALDDILVEDHPCEPLGWCDFESGLSLICFLIDSVSEFFI